MSGEVDVIEYDAVAEAALESAVEDAWADYYGTGEAPSGGGGAPTQVTATANVQWNGDTSPRIHRQRTVTFRDVDLSKVADSLSRAARARSDAERAAPLKSMKAKGWRAQYRALSKTEKGRAALAQAGVSATTRTRSGWLAGRTANKGNRAAIADAYESVRNSPIRQARERAEQAHESAARLFTEAIERSENGDKIRLLGDVRLRFER